MLPPDRCNYARAAVLSARAGLDLIKSRQPHSYEALFLALGLITNTRHVWHALTIRDRKDHPEPIEAWMASPPEWSERLQALLNKARDLLIKEWVSIPQVATGDAGYEMSIYIPSHERGEQVLSGEERQDRESAALLAEAINGTAGDIRASIRIDVLVECEGILDRWDVEIERIERAMAGANHPRT